MHPRGAEQAQITFSKAADISPGAADTNFSKNCEYLYGREIISFRKNRKAVIRPILSPLRE